MSVATLIDLRDRVTQELAQRSKQLQVQLEHIGGYVSQSLRSGSHKPNPLIGHKAEIKYRDTKGNTWAGRGVHPIWLREALKRGKKLEHFAVGAAKAAAAVKKPVAKKTSMGRKAKRKAKGK